MDLQPHAEEPRCVFTPAHTECRCRQLGAGPFAVPMPAANPFANASPCPQNNKAMRQIPFNGKKLKPVSLRKDYWRPMAMVQFPSGLGVVGRSVFQKLREFRKLHELAWDNDEYLKLSKHDRGVALNDQKANTVADVATVLGGAGKGNKIWEVEPTAGQERREGEGEESKQAHGTQGKLHSATVFWANAQDQGYAASWPSNVTHQVGLPPQTRGSAPEAPQEEVVDEPVSQGTDAVVA